MYYIAKVSNKLIVSYLSVFLPSPEVPAGVALDAVVLACARGGWWERESVCGCESRFRRRSVGGGCMAVGVADARGVGGGGGEADGEGAAARAAGVEAGGWLERRALARLAAG